MDKPIAVSGLRPGKYKRGGAASPDRKPLLQQYKEYKALLIMLTPGLLYYLIFKYLPIYGLVIAFKDFNIVEGVFKSPWAGLKYFKMLFHAPDILNVSLNTIILSGLKLLIGFPAPILLALLLNEVRNTKFKKTIQTVTYIPHFISWVVLSGILIQFLSPSTGPINIILKSLGLNPIFFVADNSWFRVVLVGSSIWKEMGWSSIIYLAALTNIDIQLYEAAILDGAGRLKQTIHITLPAIAPIVVMMFILNVGSIVNDDFDQIFNLYNPTVYRVSDVLSTYIYRMGLENMQYSFATAVGLLKNVIAFGMILGTNYISKKFSEYALW